MRENRSIGCGVRKWELEREIDDLKKLIVGNWGLEVRDFRYRIKLKNFINT